MPRPSALRRIVVATIAGLLAVTAVGCTKEQNRSSAMVFINQERAARGLRGVAWSDDLGRKAQQWAGVLADRGSLAHSNLAEGVDPGWRALGENVGYGRSVKAVHDQFMRSRVHRDAITNRTFRAVGIGVEERNGRIYVVQVFKA